MDSPKTCQFCVFSRHCHRGICSLFLEKVEESLSRIRTIQAFTKRALDTESELKVLVLSDRGLKIFENTKEWFKKAQEEAFFLSKLKMSYKSGLPYSNAMI